MAVLKVDLLLLPESLSSRCNDVTCLDVFVKPNVLTKLVQEWKRESLSSPLTAALTSTACHHNNLSSSLLVHIRTLQSDSEHEATHTENCPHSFNLYVSWKFVQHFQIDIESPFSLHPVDQVYQLTNIVIGTNVDLQESEKIFHEIAKDGVILREGDNVMAQERLVLLSSHPVRQGLFCKESTKVVFVRIAETVKTPITRYLREALPRNVAHSMIDRQLSKLNIRLKEEHFGNTRKEVIDSESVIFLSQQTLRAMRAPEGSWIKCRVVLNQQHRTEFPWRLCHLLSDNRVADDEVLLSPQLLFNMTAQKPILLSSFKTSLTLDVDLKSELIKSVNLTDDDFISCLTVSLIPRPSYSGSADFSSLLSSFFSIERYIVKDDVFCIEGNSEEVTNSSSDEEPSARIQVSFKVTRVEGTGFWVQKDKSTLLQVGSCNSYVPSRYSFLTSNGHDNDNAMFRKLSCTLFPYAINLLPGSAVISISGPVGVGKQHLIRSLTSDSCRNLLTLDVNNMLLDTPAATEAKLRINLEKALVYQPCIVHLKNFDLLLQENKSNDERYAQLIRNVINSFPSEAQNAISLIGSFVDEKSFARNSSFYSIFQHHLCMKEPEEKERRHLLDIFSRQVCISPSIDLESLSKKTNGFVASDLKALISRSVCQAYHRLSKILKPEDSKDIIIAGVTVTQDDINTCLDEMLKKNKKSQGAPEIPSVKWEDIGGMEDVKKEIMETIQLPLNFPQLFSSGLKRGGLLLHGPPGTGKTLIAKAVATECSINFYSVKGPELINMYVGQSEENVRNVFSRARASTPCVIFFDELDSLAPNRGKSGDSGGVMDRVVSQLLAEMDGLSHSKGLFVIGATNRLDLLDPALLRPGRFDKIIHVPVPSDVSSRVKVLEALTRKLTLGSDVSLTEIESRCPTTFSGADFYSLVSSAMNQALSRCITLIESEELKEEEAELQVCHEDFDRALSNFPSSILL